VARGPHVHRCSAPLAGRGEGRRVAVAAVVNPAARRGRRRGRAVGAGVGHSICWGQPLDLLGPSKLQTQPRPASHADELRPRGRAVEVASSTTLELVAGSLERELLVPPVEVVHRAGEGLLVPLVDTGAAHGWMATRRPASQGRRLR
jgi:hypothetical protein